MSLQDCLSKAKNDAESDVAESRNNRSEKASLEQERILALGKAWTHFGLLQSFLLVPQGPIDPVEQLTSQLTYAELEVNINYIVLLLYLQMFTLSFWL